jgi:hypothetical protein
MCPEQKRFGLAGFSLFTPLDSGGRLFMYDMLSEGAFWGLSSHEPRGTLVRRPEPNHGGPPQWIKYNTP